MTIKEAEEIRKKVGLKPEAFAVRLGYSATAYYQAIRRGRLSRWMAAEIRRRFRAR